MPRNKHLLRVREATDRDVVTPRSICLASWKSSIARLGHEARAGDAIPKRGRFVTRRSPIGAPMLTVKAPRMVETIATVVSRKWANEGRHFTSRDEGRNDVPQCGRQDDSPQLQSLGLLTLRRYAATSACSEVSRIQLDQLARINRPWFECSSSVDSRTTVPNRSWMYARTSEI